MTIFEFVFALYSIIISLGLTHLLSGLVDLRKAARVRFSLPHAFWAGATLLISIGNWATMWELRLVEDWPAWMVLLLLATALGQYLCCAFVTPDTVAGAEVDLVAFHDRERVRYVGAFIGLIAISMTFNFAFGTSGHYSDWLRDILVSTPAILATFMALFFSGRRVQLVSAAVMFGISVYFLILATALSA